VKVGIALCVHMYRSPFEVRQRLEEIHTLCTRRVAQLILSNKEQMARFQAPLNAILRQLSIVGLDILR
jgi:hypothetical protein